jgi:hypothetical protein
VAAFIAYRVAMPYAFKPPSVLDLFTLRLGHFGPFPVPYPDIMNQHWIRDQVDQQQLLSGDAAHEVALAAAADGLVGHGTGVRDHGVAGRRVRGGLGVP